MIAAARVKVGEWTDNAGDAMALAAIAAEPVTEAVEQWGADAKDAVSRFGSSAKSAVDQGSDTIYRIAQDPEERDKYLLGAAAVALIAAVGIASQRRPSDPPVSGNGYQPHPWPPSEVGPGSST